MDPLEGTNEHFLYKYFLSFLKSAYFSQIWQEFSSLKNFAPSNSALNQYMT